MAGRTLYDKIWETHTVERLSTGQDQIFIGLHLIHEITTAPAFDMLREKGFDEEFIRLLVSHGYGFDCAGLLNKKRSEKKEFILAAGETVTGIIHAYALMRGGVEGMEVKGLKKKFKDKRFAAGCHREIVREIENVMDFDEFLEVAIEAIASIKKEVGL